MAPIILAPPNSIFPGLSRSPWYAREWPVTALGGMPPLVVASITAFKEDSFYKKWALAFSAVWLFGVTVLRIMQSMHKDTRQARHESPTDISGCLHVLYMVLKRHCRIGDSDKDIGLLRLTVHRIDGEHLEQCVPYVGGPGGPEGRRVSIRTGIVGLAARTGKPHAAQRVKDDQSEFLDELVETWHFTRTEAEHISPDRRAWMAVPVHGESGPIAVVFLDSSRVNFFTEEVQEIVLAACKGLASFVKMRYKTHKG